VLAGKCPVEEAIETDFSPSLHLLTAGQLANSPHRLAGNGEFAGLLENLRGMYRYIVVDTPPILPASEALVMARAADAAVLCAPRLQPCRSVEAYERLQAAASRQRARAQWHSGPQRPAHTAATTTRARSRWRAGAEASAEAIPCSSA
jgi:septum formation inhibitor-activating ATPase MinD